MNLPQFAANIAMFRTIIGAHLEVEDFVGNYGSKIFLIYLVVIKWTKHKYSGFVTEYDSIPFVSDAIAINQQGLQSPTERFVTAVVNTLNKSAVFEVHDVETVADFEATFSMYPKRMPHIRAV